ncbi:hypothetical protein BCR37DRAFT_384381 [Protomyces lactucae-debilis]|uniref:Uncharacterized protein n=1 Tax=Protomyces lactucae-debilis TaxID=2754530 RepID=A0A1Y2ESM8_PROLT|nr:uncharacterized protein BCR37DRAFT_384381 [Protomyces lactucae-debilis]ORY74579.1 hypothetical protein BCR37DRAFT_384381 [Protomyces lactucae-debilis]
MSQLYCWISQVFEVFHILPFCELNPWRNLYLREKCWLLIALLRFEKKRIHVCVLYLAPFALSCKFEIILCPILRLYCAGNTNKDIALRRRHTWNIFAEECAHGSCKEAYL